MGQGPLGIKAQAGVGPSLRGASLALAVLGPGCQALGRGHHPGPLPHLRRGSDDPPMGLLGLHRLMAWKLPERGMPVSQSVCRGIPTPISVGSPNFAFKEMYTLSSESEGCNALPHRGAGELQMNLCTHPYVPGRGVQKLQPTLHLPLKE